METIVAELVRVSIPIPKELNDRLNHLLPWGIKAQVVRELILLLLKTQEREATRYIVQDLLKGNCQLTCSNFEQSRSNNDEAI